MRGKKNSSPTKQAAKNAARSRAYYVANKESHKASVKAWKLANADRCSEINAAGYTKNSDKSAVNRKAWRAANTGRANEYMRVWHLKMCEALAGRKKPNRCDVCNRSGRICFDHCHMSQKFRGWLCHRCNSALGYAKDSAVLLRKLAAYLDQPLMYAIPVNSHCRMSAADKRTLGPRPNKCQVCRQTGRIVMDHCHKRNLFRGWLCDHCNSVLGYASDSSKVLNMLADYLDNDKQKQKELKKNAKTKK